MLEFMATMMEFLQINNVGNPIHRCLIANINKNQVLGKHVFQGYDLQCSNFANRSYSSKERKKYKVEYNITKLQNEINTVLVPELVTNGTNCGDAFLSKSTSEIYAEYWHVIPRDNLKCNCFKLNITGCIEDTSPHPT